MFGAKIKSHFYPKMETQETLKLDSMSTLQLPIETTFSKTLPVIEIILSQSNVDEIKDKKENSLGINTKSTKVTSTPSSKVASLFEIQNTLDDSLPNNINENGNGLNGGSHLKMVVETSNGDKSLNGNGNHTKMYIEDTESEGEDVKEFNESPNTNKKSFNCTNKSNMNNTTGDFHLEMSKSFNDQSNVSIAAKVAFIIPDTLAVDDCDTAAEQSKKNKEEIISNDSVVEQVNSTEQDIQATDTIQINTDEDIIPPTQVVQEVTVTIEVTPIIDEIVEPKTTEIIETDVVEITPPPPPPTELNLPEIVQVIEKEIEPEIIAQSEIAIPQEIDQPEIIEEKAVPLEDIAEKVNLATSDFITENLITSDVAEVTLVKPVDKQFCAIKSFEATQTKIDDESIIISDEEESEVINTKSQTIDASQQSIIIPTTIMDTSVYNETTDTETMMSQVEKVETTTTIVETKTPSRSRGRPSSKPHIVTEETPVDKPAAKRGRSVKVDTPIVAQDEIVQNPAEPETISRSSRRSTRVSIAPVSVVAIEVKTPGNRSVSRKSIKQNKELEEIDNKVEEVVNGLPEKDKDVEVKETEAKDDVQEVLAAKEVEINKVVESKEVVSDETKLNVDIVVEEKVDTSITTDPKSIEVPSEPVLESVAEEPEASLSTNDKPTSSIVRRSSVRVKNNTMTNCMSNLAAIKEAKSKLKKNEVKKVVEEVIPKDVEEEVEDTPVLKPSEISITNTSIVKRGRKPKKVSNDVTVENTILENGDADNESDEPQETDSKPQAPKRTKKTTKEIPPTTIPKITRNRRQTVAITSSVIEQVAALEIKKTRKTTQKNDTSLDQSKQPAKRNKNVYTYKNDELSDQNSGATSKKKPKNSELVEEIQPVNLKKTRKTKNDVSTDPEQEISTNKRVRKRNSKTALIAASSNQTLGTPGYKTPNKIFFHSKGASALLLSGQKKSLEFSPTNTSKLNTSKNSNSSKSNSPNKKFKLHKAKSSSSENLNDLSDLSDVEKEKKVIPPPPVTVATVVVDEVVVKPKKAAPAPKKSLAAPTSTRVSRNTKLNSLAPKIMATGIILSDKEKQIVANLGGQIVTDCHECTHLVTNKIRKTYKFLSCLSRGTFILNERWLDESNKSKMFLNTASFALSDVQSEKRYKFTLQSSLTKAKSSPLLEGWKFLIIHQDENQEMSCNDIKIIIECANGQVIDSLPKDENELANCCIIYSDYETFKKDNSTNAQLDVLKMTLDEFLNFILKQNFDHLHKIEQQNGALDV